MQCCDRKLYRVVNSFNGEENVFGKNNNVKIKIYHVFFFNQLDFIIFCWQFCLFWKSRSLLCSFNRTLCIDQNSAKVLKADLDRRLEPQQWTGISCLITKRNELSVEVCGKPHFAGNIAQEWRVFLFANLFPIEKNLLL